MVASGYVEFRKCMLHALWGEALTISVLQRAKVVRTVKVLLLVKDRFGCEVDTPPTTGTRVTLCPTHAFAVVSRARTDMYCTVAARDWCNSMEIFSCLVVLQRSV